MPPQKIVFLAPHDPRDPEKWSGTIYSIYRALEDNSEGIEVVPVSGEAVNFVGRALNKILQRANFKIDCRFSTLFALIAGAYLSIRLWFVAGGPIVAIAASNYLPYLKTRRRIIYISDATFQAICRLYPSFNALPDWLKRQGDANEATTLRKAEHVIYPSEWASLSAQVDYKISGEKISEIPFGPNIPDALIEDYYVPKSLDGKEVRIVFVSADWIRKNGDLTVEVCRLLKDRGVNIRLITIGNTPDHIKRIDFVEDYGFLHKSNPEELAKLCAAYRNAHFLLLPSTADAFGIVFSEAQAFGVPPVTYDVGGIGSAVINGKSGILLPPNSAASAFAKEMMPYVRDAKSYKELSGSCRKWQVEQANWTNWSKLIIQLTRPKVR